MSLRINDIALDFTAETTQGPIHFHEWIGEGWAVLFSHTSEGRTPANNAPVRTAFVIGPDKRIKLTLAYPMTTGRNFDEIVRVLDSIQLTAKHRVATPANWRQGDDVMITGAVSNEEADKIFPGYKTVKPYLRTTAQPQLV